MVVVGVAGLLAKVSIGASILATKTDTADSAVYVSDNNDHQLTPKYFSAPPHTTQLLSPFLYMHADRTRSVACTVTRMHALQMHTVS